MKTPSVVNGADIAGDGVHVLLTARRRGLATNKPVPSIGPRAGLPVRLS